MYLIVNFKISCIGKDNIEHYFDGVWSDEGSTIRFSLNIEDQATKGSVITFNLLQPYNNEMKVKEMYIDRLEFRGLGIPDALILKAKELFSKTIVSSTKFQDNDEILHQDGERVWKRLVENQKAIFDEKSGRYKTL